jgi:hypothetical protein
MTNGDLAHEIRSTVAANRTGRPRGSGGKTFKRGARGVITVLALGMIVATIATSASLADKCQQGNNPHCAGSGGGGGGGTGGSGSLSLVMVNDLNGDGQPNWGDTVTFNISTTATTEPNVSLTCYQSGVLVYSAVSGFYASYPWPWTQNMGLWSNSWTGGAADCTAELYYFNGSKTVTVATLDIPVAA